MKNFTLKVAAVLACAAFAGVSYAGTPFGQKPVLSKDAKIVIEGENFDKGGQEVAFHTEATGIGGVGAGYRDDIVAADGETKLVGINYSEDASNEYIVGWTNNMWVVYTVDVKDAGNYRFTMHAGAGGDGKAKWALTNVQEEITADGVLDRDDFITYDNPNLTSSVVLSFSEAGEYEIKFSTPGGFNFDCWDVEYTTEAVTFNGNVIPGLLDASNFIKDEEQFHLGAIHAGNLQLAQLYGSDHIGWLNQPGWDNLCESPDYFKYKTYIIKPGDYYVFFEAAGPEGDNGELSLYYYNNATPIVENIQFLRSGGWDDYEWAIGGTVTDVENREVEHMVVTIKDEWVSKDIKDLKTIRLEVSKGFNLKHIAFIPVEDYNIDEFDPDEFDPAAIVAAGVNVIVAQPVDNNYYNLQGMKVAQPTKGIFIHNGKKVVVK